MATFTRKKYLRLAQTFYGRARNCYRIMIPKVEKALQYAYRDRRRKRRDFRASWITTITAGVREHNTLYNKFIYGLNYSNIDLNRKVLANLAINEPYTFKAIVDEVKIQAHLPEEYKRDMEFVEALSRNYLVFEEVKPLPEENPSTIDYIQIDPHADKELREKARFFYDKEAKNYYDK